MWTARIELKTSNACKLPGKQIVSNCKPFEPFGCMNGLNRFFLY